jgi:RNA polymerase sigma-70 factor (ECF subfamily)
MDVPEDDSKELAKCLERLAEGDLKARDSVIQIVSGRLHSLAHRMLGRYPGVRRWEDTDDVFQNAAMRLHRALGAMQFDMPRSVMALAATQLHRELIDLARRHAGPASYAANHGTNAMPKAAEEEGPDHYIDNQSANDSNLDRWTLFHEAIANLPENDREVFHLVWYLGADQKTIATLLDCSERTVKYRWRSAREAVRAALDGKAP